MLQSFSHNCIAELIIKQKLFRDSKEETYPWVNRCGYGIIDVQELDDLGPKLIQNSWKTETKEKEGKYLEPAKRKRAA